MSAKIRETYEQMLSQNAGLKAIAFLLTLAVVIWVRDDRDDVMPASVSIKLSVPSDMVLVSNRVDKVDLSISGRWSDLRSLDPNAIPPIEIKLNREDRNRRIQITSDMIELPPGVRATSITPGSVVVQLEPLLTKTVRVRPRILGQPQDSYRLGEFIVRPETIEVSGPKSSVDSLEFIITEPIDVAGQTETMKQSVRLTVEDPHLMYDLSTRIRVEVPIQTVEASRTIQGIAVVVLNTHYITEVQPTQVSIVVRGPKESVDKLVPESIHAAIDMKVESALPAGTTYSKQPSIKNLPPDLVLESFHPNDILVKMRKKPTKAPLKAPEKVPDKPPTKPPN